MLVTISSSYYNFIMQFIIVCHDNSLKPIKLLSGWSVLA